MSEALIRRCPKCQQPFVKEDGCNKMRCAQCGTYSCFCCRAIIDSKTPYTHFANRATDKTGCPLVRHTLTYGLAGSYPVQRDDTEDRLRKEIEDARAKASSDVRSKNPEVDQEMLDRLKNPASSSGSLQLPDAQNGAIVAGGECVSKQLCGLRQMTQGPTTGGRALARHRVCSAKSSSSCPAPSLNF